MSPSSFTTTSWGWVSAARPRSNARTTLPPRARAPSAADRSGPITVIHGSRSAQLSASSRVPSLEPSSTITHCAGR